MKRERVDDSIFNSLFRRIMENKSEQEEKKRKRLFIFVKDLTRNTVFL